jgi:hypothetical protein
MQACTYIHGHGHVKINIHNETQKAVCITPLRHGHGHGHGIFILATHPVTCSTCWHNLHKSIKTLKGAVCWTPMIAWYFTMMKDTVTRPQGSGHWITVNHANHITGQHCSPAHHFPLEHVAKIKAPVTVTVTVTVTSSQCATANSIHRVIWAHGTLGLGHSESWTQLHKQHSTRAHPPGIRLNEQALKTGTSKMIV